MKLILRFLLSFIFSIQFVYGQNIFNPNYEIVFPHHLDVTQINQPQNYLEWSFYDSIQVLNKSTGEICTVTHFDLWHFRANDPVYEYLLVPAENSNFTVAMPSSFELKNKDSIIIRNLTIVENNKKRILPDINFYVTEPLWLVPKFANKIFDNEIHPDNLSSLSIDTLQLYNYKTKEIYKVKRFKLFYEVYKTKEQLEHPSTAFVSCGPGQHNLIQMKTFESNNGSFTKEMIDCMKQAKITDKLRFVDVFYLENNEEKRVGEIELRIK